MSDNIPLNERIIVALDVTEKDQAKDNMLVNIIMLW